MLENDKTSLRRLPLSSLSFYFDDCSFHLFTSKTKSKNFNTSSNIAFEIFICKRQNDA